MNLADYLSELLGQYDEVSVPGLGYFVRERVKGYYNDQEAKFYPPYHQVKFVNQLKDDDTFAEYVAEKKNISIASSKYFAEKFVSQLKDQALTGKYLFADLGLFYTEQGQLVFKPNDKVADDPSFYGYPPLNAYKVVQSFNGESKPVFTETGPGPVTLAPPVQTIEQQQYFEEEIDRKKSVNIWLVLIGIIVFIALTIFGIYKFYPAAFDKLNATYHSIIGKKDTATVIKHDTTNDAASKTIRPAAIVAAKPVDTANNHWQYDVILHDEFKQLVSANAEVRFLKSKGVEARVLPLTEAPGPLYKISFKTCTTRAEAEQAMLDLVNEGKINKDLLILSINTQK
ncbi:hypothetical protein [Mucilaginibacter sp.]|uniref:HU domain-containing protein n=1 Tax=Mucilaginibacter sp. TaxID=1882438 RepID=UPI003D0D1A96